MKPTVTKSASFNKSRQEKESQCTEHVLYSSEFSAGEWGGEGQASHKASHRFNCAMKHLRQVILCFVSVETELLSPVLTTTQTVYRPGQCKRV